MSLDDPDLRFALERALAHAEDAIAVIAPFTTAEDALAQAAVDVAGELDGFAGAIELALARGGRQARPDLPWELMASAGRDVLAFDDEGRAGLDPEAALRNASELLPPFVVALKRALAAPAAASPAASPPRPHPQPRRGRARR